MCSTLIAIFFPMYCCQHLMQSDMHHGTTPQYTHAPSTVSAIYLLNPTTTDMASHQPLVWLYIILQHSSMSPWQLVIHTAQSLQDHYSSPTSSYTPAPPPVPPSTSPPAQPLPRPYSQVRGLSCNTNGDIVPSLRVSKEVYTASRRVDHTLLSSITGGAPHPLPPPHVNCSLQTFACRVPSESLQLRGLELWTPVSRPVSIHLLLLLQTSFEQCDLLLYRLKRAVSWLGLNRRHIVCV